MRRLTVFLALVLIAGAVAASARSLTGTIAGKVVYEQGGVLPGVTVTLLARTGAQATVTDEKGEYRFVGLNPGPYEVKAELSGFTPRTERGLDLGIGRTLSVPFTLRVGGLAETVDVVANASTVDTKTTASDNSLSQDPLSNIPVNMENFNVATKLLDYAPGVTMGRRSEATATTAMRCSSMAWIPATPRAAPPGCSIPSTSSRRSRLAAWGPRLGATFDLTGKVTSVLRASWGRYYEGAAFNPYNQAVGGWTPWQSYEVISPGSLELFDETIIRGNWKVVSNLEYYSLDETTVGFEQELRRDLKVAVTGIWRTWDNFVGAVIKGSTWTPFTRNLPEPNNSDSYPALYPLSVGKQNGQPRRRHHQFQGVPFP